MGQIGFFCIHPGCKRDKSFARFHTLQAHNAEHKQEPGFVRLIAGKQSRELQLQRAFHYEVISLGRSTRHDKGAAATPTEVDELNLTQANTGRKRSTPEILATASPRRMSKSLLLWILSVFYSQNCASTYSLL
ncbi:TPA: hypothetical protein ACH3X1_004871 [Trebouxia sp. C0004]